MGGVIMKKILIIEDDVDINEMIYWMLQNNGYQAYCAYSGSEALLFLNQNEVDLILLDLMLPGVTGEQVVERFENKNQIPIIVLTALSDTLTITTLLRKGANDYIVKPFDYTVLLARIEVQLRISSTSIKEAPSIITHKNMTLNLNNYTVSIHDNYLSFSKRDFEILKALLQNKNQVFTKEAMYRLAWQEEYYGDENIINVHISNIRKKLAQYDPNEEYIETIWGIGIKLHP